MNSHLVNFIDHMTKFTPVDREMNSHLVNFIDHMTKFTPVDREMNSHLVNFIDHKTNFRRIFLAKTIDEAVTKFSNFVGHFER